MKSKSPNSQTGKTQPKKAVAKVPALDETTQVPARLDVEQAALKLAENGGEHRITIPIDYVLLIAVARVAQAQNCGLGEAYDMAMHMSTDPDGGGQPLGYMLDRAEDLVIEALEDTGPQTQEAAAAGPDSRAQAEAPTVDV